MTGPIFLLAIDIFKPMATAQLHFFYETWQEVTAK